MELLYVHLEKWPLKRRQRERDREREFITIILIAKLQYQIIVTIATAITASTINLIIAMQLCRLYRTSFMLVPLVYGTCAAGRQYNIAVGNMLVRLHANSAMQRPLA